MHFWKSQMEHRHKTKYRCVGAFQTPLGAPAHPCVHQPRGSAAGSLDANYILPIICNVVIFERQYNII